MMVKTLSDYCNYNAMLILHKSLILLIFCPFVPILFPSVGMYGD